MLTNRTNTAYHSYSSSSSSLESYKSTHKTPPDSEKNSKTVKTPTKNYLRQPLHNEADIETTNNKAIKKWKNPRQCISCNKKLPKKISNHKCPEDIIEKANTADYETFYFPVRRRLADADSCSLSSRLMALFSNKNISWESTGHYTTDALKNFASTKETPILCRFTMVDLLADKTGKTLSCKDIHIKINKSFKLELVIHDESKINNLKYHVMYSCIHPAIQKLPRRFTRVHDTFLPCVTEITITTRKLYTFEIHAHLSQDHSQIVCQHKLTASDVAGLNEIYKNDKTNAPKSFVDFIDFFSSTGLSNAYTDRYGSNIQWVIKILEQDR